MLILAATVILPEDTCVWRDIWDVRHCPMPEWEQTQMAEGNEGPDPSTAHTALAERWPALCGLLKHHLPEYALIPSRNNDFSMTLSAS